VDSDDELKGFTAALDDEAMGSNKVESNEDSNDGLKKGITGVLDDEAMASSMGDGIRTVLVADNRLREFAGALDDEAIDSSTGDGTGPVLVANDRLRGFAGALNSEAMASSTADGTRPVLVADDRLRGIAGALDDEAMDSSAGAVDRPAAAVAFFSPALFPHRQRNRSRKPDRLGLSDGRSSSPPPEIACSMPRSRASYGHLSGALKRVPPHPLFGGKWPCSRDGLCS
jgi:hypothetical protein